jgi:hypothetical protein
LTYSKIKLTTIIRNPSDRDISGFGASFDIYSADSFVGNGNFSGVFIPEQSGHVQNVFFTVYYADVTNAVMAGLTKKNFVPVIEGEVYAAFFFDFITVSKGIRAYQSYR